MFPRPGTGSQAAGADRCDGLKRSADSFRIWQFCRIGESAVFLRSWGGTRPLWWARPARKRKKTHGAAGGGQLEPGSAGSLNDNAGKFINTDRIRVIRAVPKERKNL